MSKLENLKVGLFNYEIETENIKSLNDERLMNTLCGLSVLEHLSIGQGDVYYNTQTLIRKVKDEIHNRIK